MEAILDPLFHQTVLEKKLPGIAAIVLDKSGTVLFKGGYGENNANNPSAGKTSTDTSFMLWSISKIFTVVATLQLVEQGRLSLKDLAEDYMPSISDIPVLSGFDADDKPILSPAKNKITILNLLTHTAGFTYDHFDPETNRYRKATGQPVTAYAARSSWENYSTPLCAEPGTKYCYGISIDWLGFVVEKIVGMELGEYIKRSIVEPLKLQKTGPAHTFTDAQAADFLEIHARDPQGDLVSTGLRFTPAEVREPAGHFLISSVQDVSQLLLTLINNGTHPITKTQILKPQTVKDYIFTDLLSAVPITTNDLGEITSANLDAIKPGTYLPDVKKGWSASLLINHDSLPNGRKAGSASWIGFGNAFYWMDPEAGLVGFIATELVPFWDRDILFLADAIERAAYGKALATVPGEAESNFTVHDLK